MVALTRLADVSEQSSDTQPPGSQHFDVIVLGAGPGQERGHPRR